MANYVLIIGDRLENIPKTFNPINKVDDVYETNDNREITIYTFGKKTHIKHPNCEIIFDLTKYLYDTKSNKQNGIDNNVQKEIIKNKHFTILLEKIVKIIEKYDIHKLGLMCNSGNYCSVAWAELIKKIYYNKAKLEHLNIK